MSKGDIHINVSGGNADFGNIALGDKNKLQDSRTYLTESIQEFFQSLDEIQGSQGIAQEQIVRLKKEVELLSKEKDGSKLAERLKALYRDYSWAIDPLRKLVAGIVS